MKKEMIDFFNEKGDYILTAPLETKHKENRHLYIKGVHIFIINDKEEILIQRRREDHTILNRWEIPSGHVGFKESFEEAAYRELEEETGIMTSLKYIKTMKIDMPNEFVAFFIGRSNILPNPKNNSEADAFEFISLYHLINEIKKNIRLFSPKIVKFLKCHKEDFVAIIKKKQDELS